MATPTPSSTGSHKGQRSRSAANASLSRAVGLCQNDVIDNATRYHNRFCKTDNREA